jgi:hypothetical protein
MYDGEGKIVYWVEAAGLKEAPQVAQHVRLVKSGHRILIPKTS